MLNKIDAYAKSVDVYPLVKYYLDELNLFELFKKYVPKGNAELEPAEGLCILIVNILTTNRPLYKIEEWLADYADGKGETIKEAAKYNDDHLGRNCLDRLYKADRNSLMTELSIKAIKAHKLMTNVLHNDTTSLTLHGTYDNSTTTDGIKPARGYNKDGHPDCKQIVFGLNVTGDGHVPISYMAHNGNTSDSNTHIPNWDKLRELLNKDDFIYVKDSKGADIENLSHIAGNGGKFISVLPATRLEVKEFRNRLKSKEKIAWQESLSIENSRRKGDFTNYHTFETKSREDYRIIWVHSDSKARQDAKLRQKKIEAAWQKLQTIANKLNRYQLKTREKIERAVQRAVVGVKDYVLVQITEHTTTERKQKGRGKAGSNTQFVDVSQTTYELNWQRNTSALKEAACTDGVFPLISNCKLTATEVLQTYKQQSYLEKRHSTLKTVEQVCPIYLKKPQRIEAMLFLYFVALMIISLIERNIRNKMQESAAGFEPALNSSQVKPILPEDEQQRVSAYPTGTNETVQATESKAVLLEEQPHLPEKGSKPVVSTEPETTVIKPQVLPVESSKPLPITLPEKGSKSVASIEPKTTSTVRNTLPESTNITQPPELIPKAIPSPQRLALPILPQGMKTETPTWANIKYFFRNVYQEVITSSDDILKTVLKGMTLLHFQVLELLEIPFSVYNGLDEEPWWRFQND